MIGKQVLFYATKQDIEGIIADLEAQLSIRYFEIGMFDNIAGENYFNSYTEIPDFGSAKNQDTRLNLSLMAMEKRKP